MGRSLYIGVLDLILDIQQIKQEVRAQEKPLLKQRRGGQEGTKIKGILNLFWSISVHTCEEIMVLPFAENQI